MIQGVIDADLVRSFFAGITSEKFQGGECALCINIRRKVHPTEAIFLEQAWEGVVRLRYCGLSRGFTSLKARLSKIYERRVQWHPHHPHLMPGLVIFAQLINTRSHTEAYRGLLNSVGVYIVKVSLVVRSATAIYMLNN